MNNAASAAVPWQYWLISGISLLWNAFGGFDYTMTKTRNADYLANFPPEMMPFIDSMPAWATAFWALGVWGSLAGSILLLLRSRHAVAAFLASLAGAIVSFAYQYASDMPPSLRTPGFVAMTAVIVGAVVFFWWYACRARARGILR